MTNGNVEIQKEVLTPFLINRDYLGCDSGTSAEYRSQWGSHVVHFLLELCYIQLTHLKIVVAVVGIGGMPSQRFVHNDIRTDTQKNGFAEVLLTRD